MWNIDANNKITLTRGDTPTFQLSLNNADGTPYTPEEGDVLMFAIKKTAQDSELCAYIEIPTDTMILKFSETTTRYLGFGAYVYEISLNNSDNDYHDTFIANTPLIITEELYNG